MIIYKNMTAEKASLSSETCMLRVSNATIVCLVDPHSFFHDVHSTKFVLVAYTMPYAIPDYVNLFCNKHLRFKLLFLFAPVHLSLFRILSVLDSRVDLRLAGTSMLTPARLCKSTCLSQSPRKQK